MNIPGGPFWKILLLPFLPLAPLTPLTPHQEFRCHKDASPPNAFTSTPRTAPSTGWGRMLGSSHFSCSSAPAHAANILRPKKSPARRHRPIPECRVTPGSQFHGHLLSDSQFHEERERRMTLSIRAPCTPRQKLIQRVRRSRLHSSHLNVLPPIRAQSVQVRRHPSDHPA